MDARNPDMDVIISHLENIGPGLPNKELRWTQKFVVLLLNVGKISGNTDAS